MNADQFTTHLIELIGKIIWPLIIIILFFNLKQQLTLLLETIIGKIIKSKNFELTKTGIKIESEAEITDDLATIFENRTAKEKELVENESKTKLLKDFEEISKEFNSVQITEKDLTKRVEKKGELKRKMGVLILSNSIPKNEIFAINNEGAYVGLLYAISIFPEKDDKKYLLENYERINHTFSKYTYLTTCKTLIDKGYFNQNECVQLLGIITSFKKVNEVKLLYKLELMIDILQNKIRA
jgi:hypothetical protein